MLDLLILCTKKDATPHLFLIKLTEALMLKSDWLQPCQSKEITSASKFGQTLVQSGWSAVALVIIIYSRQTVWFHVFYSTQMSFLNRKLLSAEVNLKFL